MAEGAVRYEIRLRGRQRRGWNGAFDGATIVKEADGSATLLGVVADRPAFDRLLARARDLGLCLISLRLGELERDVHGAQGRPTADRGAGPLRRARGR